MQAFFTELSVFLALYYNLFGQKTQYFQGFYAKNLLLSSHYIGDMSRFLALKFRENVTLGFNFSSIDTGPYHQLIYRDVFQLYFLQPTGRNVPLLTSLREILYLKHQPANLAYQETLHPLH